MRYVIRRNTSKGIRFAGSQYDWTLRGAPDMLIFPTRKDAQDFMDEYVWEDACVDTLLDKTRSTRTSKITQYNREVVRYWGNNPDQHNMRYQRMNMHKHICEKNNTSEMIYTMHTNINMRVNDPVIRYCETYKKQYMSLLLDSFWRRQSTSTPGGE